MSVSKDESGYLLTVKNISELPLIINAKVGVSFDQSDYKYGLILNPATGEYATYNGYWSKTPQTPIESQSLAVFNFKFAEDFDKEYFYVRFRYKDEDGEYKSIDYPLKLGIDAKEYIDVQIPIETTPTPQVPFEPTPEISPSPTPSITPTLQETPEPKNEESTDETYIETVFKILSKEQKENIYITEFMPAPITGESEWVEIYNDNNEQVSLNDWFIDDEVGSGGTAVKFSIEIQAKGFGYFELTKSLLNNTGDKVSLLDENKNLIHSIQYAKTKSNQSIQKLGNGNWYITIKNTKGGKNLDYKEALITIADKTEEKSSGELPTSEPEGGDVLGATSTIQRAENTVCTTPSNNIPYRKIPYYPMEKPFTIENIGNGQTYIITEKDQLGYMEAFISFFKKAFW